MRLVLYHRQYKLQNKYIQMYIIEKYIRMKEMLPNTRENNATGRTHCKLCVNLISKN